ncbi:putative isomerase YbhE [Fomitiporia mediterranea MF3/22]|uniref:putative isomerase YbhE n=1 Tax=Fomitiporia mediterranea (strain MF3/22) TaxID=694068 RepID=UPI0004407F7F|nr:putative isomerase YbhE [Fomitiporia mediterranea MF3/22]EJD08182.1 putative isomerase YbhE [Fomitiporia mediterranea MF3/22]
MVYRILVASYTDAIYTLAFDPAKSKDAALSLSSTLEVGHHPSWIERHPSDSSIIFTGLEQADGRLLTLKYDLNNGEGKVLSNVSSGGADPCSILATNSNVFVANYSSGTVAIYSLPSVHSPSGLKEAQLPLQFSGNGPCTERQGSSHPHQVYFSKPNSPTSLGPVEEVLVPDLGSDKIWRLRKDTDGKWEIKDEITFDKHQGGGPRHIVVYDSNLYTLLELTNTVVVHDFKSSNEKPSYVTSARLSMPEGLAPLTMLAAEILSQPPSTKYPSPYLYVSNRNDPRPHGDLISIFSPLKEGATELEHVADVSTGLAHVRGFLFFGPDDRYIIVGGANGGGVKVFERVDEGRNLKEVAHLPVNDTGAGLAPTTFLCL